MAFTSLSSQRPRARGQLGKARGGFKSKKRGLAKTALLFFWGGTHGLHKLVVAKAASTRPAWKSQRRLQEQETRPRENCPFIFLGGHAWPSQACRRKGREHEASLEKPEAASRARNAASRKLPFYFSGGARMAFTS